ncbi:MAG TPA: MarC family protein [Dehalococcoidales bacterium]|nr:MarC family protein [Dehalococcoidales bacterium]
MEYTAWQSFLLTFVPLFIVLDAVGVLPFVISMSESSTKRERRKIILNATITAAVLGFAFLFLGKFILDLMGISVGSFAIGGGIILMVLAINFLVSGRSIEADKEEMVAVVPLGTPLTVGPATIATLLLLTTQFPLYWVVISFTLNIILVWVIFSSGGFFMKILGKGGIRAVSKVSSLLLAAIAVNMVIRGLSMLGILDLPSI